MKNSLSFLTLFLVLGLARCSIEESEDGLIYGSFEGRWNLLSQEVGAAGNIAPFNLFQIKQGTALVYFTDFGHKSGKVEALVVELLMPKYYDEKMLKLIINLVDSFNKQQGRWKGIKNASYQIFDRTATSEVGDIQLHFMIDQDLIALKTDQKLSIIISYQTKIISPATSFIFAVVAFTMFLLSRRRRQIEQTNIRHEKAGLILSVLMTLLISIVEIIIGLRSLFGIMSPEAFLTVSGILNLSVCYQVVRFYGKLIISKTRNVLIVWVLSFAYIWFLLYFRHNYICLILNSLIFLPEIGYHCYRGQKIKGDYRFILFLLYNQVYVLYFKACPENMFKQSPSYLLMYCISSMLIVQTAMLLGQICLGPRFFIPTALLPAYHNYHDRKLAKLAAKATDDCYICLEPIKLGTGAKNMVTPCRHVFHSKCLEKWMLVQMRCPVDRSVLPPL